MFSFEVNHLNVYREAQVGDTRPQHNWISFVVSGMIKFKSPGIDLVNPGPHFLLGGRGMHVVTEFGPNRENWVIQLATDGMRLSRRPGWVEIRSGKKWISFPCVTPVDPAEVPGWQHEYRLLREASIEPLPRNLLRLDLGIRNIFRFILDRHSVSRPNDLPVSRFRVLMEQTKTSGQTLTNLSRQTGYSPQHMRSLFRKEYGVSPAAYRTRYRMKEAMEFVTNSNLTVKEIAFRLQFRHVSHFSLAFKKTFGIPPRQAIATYRR